jgi:hypothetical protein
MTFDGATFSEERDGERLSKLFERVRALMLDGQWRTLGEIAEVVEAPEASISARLRDLRKADFGGYKVERAYVANGLWRYRVVPPPAPPAEPGGQEPLFPEASRASYRDVD